MIFGSSSFSVSSNNFVCAKKRSSPLAHALALGPLIYLGPLYFIGHYKAIRMNANKLASQLGDAPFGSPVMICLRTGQIAISQSIASPIDRPLLPNDPYSICYVQYGFTPPNSISDHQHHVRCDSSPRQREPTICEYRKHKPSSLNEVKC